MIEAKEKTRGGAGGGGGWRGGGKRSFFFLLIALCAEAHNLKTWAFDVCFMKAVVCCLFL